MKGARRYEYRLLWKYKTRKRQGLLLSQRPSAILHRLQRIATSEPWKGATVQSVRKGWAQLSLRLEVPFDTVADLPAREMMRRIQQSYPEVDWIRVEWRQVGEWTELLDPLTNLRGDSEDKRDIRMEKLYNSLDAMSQAKLNTWRMTPPSMRGDFRPSIERKQYSHAKLRRVGGQSGGVGGAAAAVEGTGAEGETGDTGER